MTLCLSSQRFLVKCPNRTGRVPDSLPELRLFLDFSLQKTLPLSQEPFALRVPPPLKVHLSAAI